jgi:hypothetical protein
MKLIDVVIDFKNINESSIIFIEDKENQNFDIILSFAEKGESCIKVEVERKCFYLIEVF